MTSRLQLTVVAEGVETPQQMALLRDLKCSHVQGNSIGRSMPAEQVRLLLAGMPSRIA